MSDAKKALLGLALAAERSGDTSRARTILDGVLKGTSQLPIQEARTRVWLSELILIENDSRMINEAHDHLTKCLGLVKKHTAYASFVCRVYSTLARCRLTLGRQTSALQALEQGMSLAKRSKLTEWQCALGLQTACAHMVSGDTKLAMDALDATEPDHSLHVIFLLARAQILLIDEKMDEVESILDELGAELSRKPAKRAKIDIDSVHVEMGDMKQVNAHFLTLYIAYKMLTGDNAAVLEKLPLLVEHTKHLTGKSPAMSYHWLSSLEQFSVLKLISSTVHAWQGAHSISLKDVDQGLLACNRMGVLAVMLLIRKAYSCCTIGEMKVSLDAIRSARTLIDTLDVDMFDDWSAVREFWLSIAGVSHTIDESTDARMIASQCLTALAQGKREEGERLLSRYDTAIEGKPWPGYQLISTLIHISLSTQPASALTRTPSMQCDILLCTMTLQGLAAQTPRQAMAILNDALSLAVSVGDVVGTVVVGEMVERAAISIGSGQDELSAGAAVMEAKRKLRSAVRKSGVKI